jgi:hypothetical protein
MKINWNSRRTAGVIIGIVSPFIFIPLIIGLIAWTQNFYYSVLWNKFMGNMIAQSRFISLAILPNLLWFYLFLNRERYDIAKGIIIGSGIFIPFIVYVNLIR